MKGWLLCVSSASLLFACTTKNIYHNDGKEKGGGAQNAPSVQLNADEQNKPASCRDAWVAAAVGRVQDERGRGVEGAYVGYCTKADTSVCLATVPTEKDGWYTYRIDANFRCVREIVANAQPKPADMGKFSPAYCKLALTAERGLLEVEEALTMYPLEAPNRPPGAARTTITFPSGLQLQLAKDDLLEDDRAEKLGAAILDLSELPCFVKPSDNLDTLVVFGPEINADIFRDKPKIGFAVPTSLAEGTKVELLLLGGFTTFADQETQLDEGSFEPYGTGTVKDGMVVPDRGSELPALTALGIRKQR